MSFNYKDYGILAGNVINASPPQTTVVGDCGSNLTINGSVNLTVLGTTSLDGDITDALFSAQSEYDAYISATPDLVDSNTNIGGTTYNPGIIQLSSSSLVIGDASIINNTVTLDGEGPYFFQVPNGGLTTITTLANVNFVLLNGAQASAVYWYVNGSVTLSSSGGFMTGWVGSIVAQGNINCGVNVTSAGTLAAPSLSGTITVTGNRLTSHTSQQQLDVITTGYIVLKSTLADSQAIQIQAAAPSGGIVMNSGTGGIGLASTGNSSFITTTSGDITLRAQAGAAYVDGTSSVNIATNTSYPAATTNIGHFLSTSQVNLRSGTGGIHANTSTGGSIALLSNGAASNFTVTSTADNQDLTISVSGAHDSSVLVASSGTGADAIGLNASAGGVTVAAVAKINVSSSVSTAQDSVSIASTNGGISQVAAKQVSLTGNTGIVMDGSNGGAGNGAVAISSGSGGIVFNAYNGGIIGLGNTQSTEILLSTAVGAKAVVLGNTSATSTILRRGTSAPLLISQTTETILSAGLTGTVTLTVSQLLSTIIVVPSISLSLVLQLPARSGLLSTLVTAAGSLGVQVGDSFDFTIVNNASLLGLSVAPNSADSPANTTIGQMTVGALSSGSFRLRITNTSTGAYTLYRLG